MMNIVIISIVEKKGVFNLDDIIQILRDERMKDICVIEISPEQQYVRYLILATAFSARHLKSTSEYINKLKSNDPYLSNECLDGSRWHHMDIGSGIFQDPPSRKHMTLDDLPHKKNVEEQTNIEVEKEFINLPSDPKPPVYKEQKVN
ncbi:unnamed protein product [Rotaria sordida]|uniref:Uncharacterized protein n=1 Tax=Rotaria sordida TaxID=392033 RepID=A0A814YY48_9BILA|nr:unnamed protein product [Rotaria sordida]CAF1235065.1 unnamed protein product [Rotaria sordida]